MIEIAKGIAIVAALFAGSMGWAAVVVAITIRLMRWPCLR